MKAGRVPSLDTTGLSQAGIWVRRSGRSPSLADEALSLAQVLQVWNLNSIMEIARYDAVYAEVSGPDLHPTWIFLVQLVGTRVDDSFLFFNHPLSQVQVGEEARILALVQPTDFLIPGALVETASRRRMIWLQPAIAR